MSILDFIKKVSSIFNAKNTLSTIGITSAMSSEMTAEIDRWCKMYRSKKGLSIPSAIASEMARLVTLEMKSKITGSNRADFINKHYQELIANIRTICEYACAKGGLMFKPYVVDDKIVIDCVQADNFIPTKYDMSGNITAVAFLTRIYKEGKTFTRVEHHDYNDKEYIINNYAFESSTNTELGKKIPLSSVPEWSNIQSSVTIEKAYAPLFAYFKMPMANPTDTESPLGISVYARASHLIDDANKQYERLLWEFESGERALYVAEEAFRRDENGKRVIPDARLYKLLNCENDELFKDWTPTLRESEIIKGLDEILRKIEFTSGLAYGTLSNVQNVDKTAEEIRASKQRSYSTVVEIQNSLNHALSELAKSMNVLCDIYGIGGKGEYSLSSEFDDSIIADRKTEFEEKMRLLSAGIIQPWEFRAWYFGEDEQTAKANVEFSPLEIEE